VEVLRVGEHPRGRGARPGVRVVRDDGLQQRPQAGALGEGPLQLVEPEQVERRLVVARVLQCAEEQVEPVEATVLEERQIGGDLQGGRRVGPDWSAAETALRSSAGVVAR
jgi:hypothetical protein